MRLTLWGIALLLFGMIAGVLLGHGAVRYQQAQAERELKDGGMSRHVAKVSLHQASLEQAVEQIQRESKTNISVNWKALESAGVDRATPITLQLKDLPLRRVLELVCTQANSDSSHLATRVDGGVIILSTSDDLSRQTVSRIYDVRDLIVADHDLRRRIERLLKKMSNDDDSQREPDNGALAAGIKTDSVQSLINVIETTIEPDSWRDAGGVVGTVKEFSGRLIIVQTPENHERIADLLEQLRNS